MSTIPTSDTEYIEQMYDNQLKSQKATLTKNYEQAVSNLDATKQQAAKQLDQNLNTTAVESQRAQKNYSEVQNAYGLTSGAMSQARLAQDNQLQAGLTALRTAHATADAEIERERVLLGQQYAAAIAQAQADNDMQKAQALYAEAKDKDAQLTAQQQAAAQLMADSGDFSLYGQVYGLSPDQIATLAAQYQADKQKQADSDSRSRQEAAAALMAQAGDFSLYQQLYQLTDEQVQLLDKAFGIGPDIQTDTGAGTDTSGEDDTGNSGNTTINELTKADVSDWGGMDWNNYFADLAGNYGGDEAVAAFQQFKNAGWIPKSALSDAELGASGYFMGAGF